MLAADARPDAQGTAQITEWVLGWFELDARPRALVETRGILRWCNRAATEFLASARELILRGGVLEPLDPKKAERFRSFLAAAGPSASAWCLPCADGDGEILFRAWRISPPGQAEVVGLVFHPTGADFSPQWADLQSIFGFTTAEAQITRLLLDGLTAQRIAERLGVSLVTVRSHIRQAYAKTAVSSREEMFRRMAPYRLV